MTLGEILLQYRKEHGLSLRQMEERTGITAAYLSNVERDKSSVSRKHINVTAATLGKIAKGMGMTVEKLMEIADDYGTPKAGNISEMPETRAVPILGRIACGTPIMAEENREGMAQVPSNITADFCLVCVGDSMTGARIYDGDIVYIRAQPSVENGEIGAVLIGEEATLKRVYQRDNILTLVAENPAYPPMIYSGTELLDIRIIGKAVAFTSVIR